MQDKLIWYWKDNNAVSVLVAGREFMSISRYV